MYPRDYALQRTASMPWWHSGLSCPGHVVRPVVDGLVAVDVPVTDLDVESTTRIRADPGFVVNGRPLTSKVRKGDQVAGAALATIDKCLRTH